MSEKPTESSLRADRSAAAKLLEKAGKVGAGALVAGSLAGPAAAATQEEREARRRSRPAASITWALEQDPGHIAPFGGILTIEPPGRTS